MNELRKEAVNFENYETKSVLKNVSEDIGERPEPETESEGEYEVGSDAPAEDTNQPMDMETPVSASNVRGISINPLNSGYMVKVGCQSVAVESTEKLIDMLNKYLSNPSDFETKWYSKDVRNRLDNI